jgi:glutamate formiminotransferase
VFECVINISEGRDEAVLDVLSGASGASLRDRHADDVHHRSVFTLINEPVQLITDVRSLIVKAYELLDLRRHEGVHPRFGVVDVVPFVALDARDEEEVLSLRDSTAQWISATFDVPTFLYGPVGKELRTLPEIRRAAYRGLVPTFGPTTPSPKWGSVAVGVRPLLIAWNLWLEDTSIERARSMAQSLRREHVRSLAFEVGDFVQVSCNLIAYRNVRPSEVYDQVRSLLRGAEHIRRAEVVGLIPEELLRLENPSRFEELGLDPHATIEERVRDA